MAKRIPWDEYEAAYLLDNCIKVNNKEISWKEAVSKVSKGLRQRAISKGLKIDAMFRNEAGIALQMLSMKQCYLGDKNNTLHRTIPELFKKIVKIYKEDRRVFNDILRTIGDKGNETKAKKESSLEQFQLWLEDSGYSEKTQDFLKVLKKVETLAYLKRMIKRSLFEITDIEKIEQLKAEIQNPKGIGISSKKEVRNAYDALKLYCLFLMGEEPGRDFPHIPSKTNQSKEEIVSYNRNDFFDWMLNVKKLSLKSSKVYSYSITECEHLATQVGLKTLRIYGVSYDEAKQTINFLTATEKFKEKNNAQHHRFSAALNKYLEYISKDKKREGEKSTPNRAHKPVISISQGIYLRYAEILKKYFSENGFQAGHSIFIRRLRNYYESEYGNEPAESDKQIDLILRKVGTIRGGRIFPAQGKKEDDLVDKIVADIMGVFNNGMKCVFIDAVYEKYEKELADCLKIYDKDEFAKLLLSSTKKELEKKKSCLVQSGKSVNISSSVTENIISIMRESYTPLSYDDIRQKAWYIPIDKIKSALVKEKAVVNVAAETYFYAPNLPVNPNEIAQLAEAINEKLDYQYYITGVELQDLIENRVPSITLNTGGYTTYGLRNCLGYILRNQFSFKGPIISKAGQDLSMRKVYTDFARSRDVLNIADLKQFSDEVGVVIYWDAVLEEKIRISEEYMISKEQIHFNVEEIDEILERRYPDEYTPLKEVRLLRHLPNVGYVWNSYLLESYIFNYSKKFRLIHASFAQDNVCGAMVRTGSPILDYRALIVDVLSHSDALGSSKQALQYIVDHGYQKVRRYDGIDDLISEAKLKLLKINN